MTVHASPLATTYAANMPRISRDVAAIEVVIDPHGAQPPGEKVIGRGTAEEGGGPLRGGLELRNRFTASIRDPEVPYDVLITVAAIDGWLAAEAVRVSRRQGGPAVSADGLRSVALSLYMSRIRQELETAAGGFFISKPAARGQGWVSYDMPLTPDVARIAELRRAVRQAKVTPKVAAEAYLAALASPDPEQNRRPTAAAAEQLGVSRGYISGLLTQARRMGIEGLGEGRPSKRKGSR